MLHLYQLSFENEVSIVLIHQLRLTHYTVIQALNCLKSTTVIKVAIQTISVTQMKLSHATTKVTLFAVSKDKWNTMENTGKSIKMHYMYCGMPKVTSQTEATLNSEKIKPISSYTCLKASVSQLLISQLVTRKFCSIKDFYNSVAMFECILG